MDITPAEAAKTEAAKQAVILLFMLLGILAVMAVQQPDFLRTLRMRVAAASNRVLSSLSRRAGHISMGIELQTGVQEYSLPYKLSQLRDMASRKYKEESDGS